MLGGVCERHCKINDVYPQGLVINMLYIYSRWFQLQEVYSPLNYNRKHRWPFLTSTAHPGFGVQTFLQHTFSNLLNGLHLLKKRGDHAQAPPPHERGFLPRMKAQWEIFAIPSRFPDHKLPKEQDDVCVVLPLNSENLAQGLGQHAHRKTRGILLNATRSPLPSAESGSES